MSEGLPQQIDVRRLADSGRHLQGELSLDQFTRLSKLVEVSGHTPMFPLSLDFSRLDNGQRVITGHISGGVSMICQRCLEPVKVILDCDISLGLVEDDAEAELLPDKLDPLITGEATHLYELLEDELLLAMPIVPLHDHCELPGNLASDQSDNEEFSGQENPFAVLASLKKEK
jgi:uncharacterized protein